MSAKKVQIVARPSAKPPQPNPDEWVESRAQPDGQEAVKRLTIDIPETLHRQIKVQCAMRGTTIADEIRDLLVQKYGKA